MASFPPPKRHPYDQWSPDTRALDLVGDKWTLLIVRDLAAGPRRFVELQRVLPGISTEQLRSRLNRMVADGLLTRQRYREVPPRVDYELTDRAKELMPVLGALARWGYDWAWSEPRPGEAERLPSLEEDAEQPEDEGHPQRDLDRGPDDLHRIDVAERGGGEDSGEPEAEHGPESEGAQHRREHTGDPPEDADPARHRPSIVAPRSVCLQVGCRWYGVGP